MGEITRYIGIDLTRDRANHTLELTEIPYTKSVIAKFGLNLKATSVPLNPYHDYRAKNEGEVNPPIHGELGSLRYLSDRTKPTLQLPLSLLQTGVLNPTQVQLDGVKHVIIYLTGSVSDGLTFAKGLETDPLVELFGMCDASYIPAYDSKGELGYALFLNLNSGAIEAKSCKDSTVSTSAAHVELKAMHLLMLSIIWTRGFLMLRTTRTNHNMDRFRISTTASYDISIVIQIATSNDENQCDPSRISEQGNSDKVD